MSKYYVYCLIDPETKLPFYVGKGSGQRAWSHTTKVKAGKSLDNPYTESVIKQIYNRGQEPIIEIRFSGLDEDTAYLKEEKLTIQYGRRRFDTDGILTNLCIGGRPPIQFGTTKDHTGEKNPNYGKRHPGLNSGTDNAMFGLKGDRNPNFGSKRSEETKAKMSSKKKGFSYEERFGPEKAAELCERKRQSMLARFSK